MLIYPALDIFEGKCVRLRQGDYATQKVYSDSPADVARSFVESGLDHLHIVDLEGAKMGRIVNRKAIEAVLRVPGIHAHVGGGIRSRSDISYLFIAGATRVVIGSVAVKTPHIVQEWLREFRSDRFVIAVDVRDGCVAHSGWLAQANLTPSVFIESMSQFGASYFLCTDIDKDGMLEGANAGLYSTLSTEFPTLHFIASGGISRISDIESVEKAGCWGAVVGKAIYEGHLNPSELSRLSKA
ncbi:MAG: 1-(5-phosphoribosyl)-5-[(5-phosphoribosylamino)methylideneamino]imidazole-4-carboxamide isomerase [Ignavibacteriales bacterium]|nr:1-(5-phosphoribosyl)-5-[(5-phosphoribosylamino)methylideneamino]imidazole-4-carboxamide isomerase [Ignavibacteriales bacterium]